MVALLILAGTAGAVAAAGPEPSPALSPEEVVRIQMNALKTNGTDGTDDGIAITFRFASPRNKAMTGPLERFAAMIRNPLYEPMLNHRRAQFENLRVSGDAARIDVIVEAAGGDLVGYRFTLSRQHGNDYEGDWMTDGVERIRITTL